MSWRDLTLEDAQAWLRSEAMRYVAIARDHAERSQVLREGSDRIQPSLLRAQGLERCALDATATAQQFLGYAMAISALQRELSPPAPGQPARLPATFLRPCAEEDFPGQGLFRLETGEVVRAPLASPPAAPTPPADPFEGFARIIDAPGAATAFGDVGHFATVSPPADADDQRRSA